MSIHARRLNSPQLSAALTLLKNGGEYTTREIAAAAHSLCAHTVIAEINSHIKPARVKCTQRGKLFYYQLIEGEAA